MNYTLTRPSSCLNGFRYMHVRLSKLKAASCNDLFARICIKFSFPSPSLSPCCLPSSHCGVQKWHTRTQTLTSAKSSVSPEWCVLHMHKVKRLQFFYIANVLNLNVCSQTYCRRSNSVGSIILEFFGDRKIHTANQRLVCTDEKARGQVARRFLLL